MPKSATWDDIESFLHADEWTTTRETSHEFFEKLLPNGDLLRTHVSRSGHKTLGPGRFRAILRNQLCVSESDFWDTVRSGRPVVRPSETDEPRAQHPAWVIRVLVENLHLTAYEIESLSVEEARQLVDEFHGRPRDG